ncbi:phage antirepressor KilAC domain-containing protein [Pullulanibacillus sp. KACC 23026]|uniref:phage antirepressor n=1 Tax=Pullulanibacillus sp. KACC 23026 TaxID=3028315 RepID=UPI0023AEDEC1|nr:phage antirepressor KilAC domain-containing protein [Pullulanibacillus sp. KACC 23026]WEG14116.1 phage antirepressor KilAC domain-containing protein [Pullulanibacillus sp. KACC 23026]
MQQIQKLFQFQSVNVRTLLINNEPWFVAKDICEVLDIKNSRDAVSRLDEDEFNTVVLTDGIGNPNRTIVNEAGLYSLILGSRKPEAKQFKRWVTHKVLPEIRKTGGYLMPQSLPEALRLAADLAEKNEFLRLQNAQKEQVINELQPKATYYDLVLQNKSLLSMSKIAKDFGLSAVSLNKMLHQLGVQYKQGDCWLLYQKYADKGYTQSKTHAIDSEKSKMHTYWTQKGRLFIYELLKNEKGILPLIERGLSA